MSLPPRTEPGRLLDGRYRLLTHLADGGMASVWLALDERLEREVALKIMRSGLAADPEFVERFRQEARSAARLSHPGLVAMFDQGRDGDDMFLVMEFVPGRTLRQLVTDEAPVGPGPALDIIDRVLDALAAAHRAGMVHRDVKPENVIVRHDGSLKVADFGLTRAVAAATTGGQPGVLLGTVSYLSPEQVEHGSADARSDVYACGLILYELLTGRKAFDGETAIHVAYQHVHGSVPAPSTTVPELPEALDRLVALGYDRLTDIVGAHCVQYFEPEPDIGRALFIWRYPSERTFRDQNLRRHLVRSQKPKSVVLQHPRHPGKQMVVAAIEAADGARQHPQGRKIEVDQLPQARPHQRADEDHVAAAFLAREAQKSAQPRDIRPMMPISLDAIRIRPAAQREQHHAASLLQERIRDRERKSSATADDGYRPFPGRLCGRVHAAPAGFPSPAEPVLVAFMIGRDPPALIKAMTFATTGSLAKPRSTASTRSLKWPRTRNNAR